MLNTGNFLKTPLGLYVLIKIKCCKKFRLFASSLSSIYAALLFSLYAMYVAGTTKPIPLSLLPMISTRMELFCYLLENDLKDSKFQLVRVPINTHLHHSFQTPPSFNPIQDGLF